MVDHLEPYRQMVRSMRFVPPVWDARPFYQHLTEPAPSRSVCHFPPASAISSNLVSLAQASSQVSSQASDSEALIRAAVEKPTILPVVYVIPESIGDRISKLTAHQPRPAVVLPPPKIPAPDPNWVPPVATVTQPAVVRPASAPVSEPADADFSSDTDEPHSAVRDSATLHPELESDRVSVSQMSALETSSSTNSQPQPEAETAAEVIEPVNPVSNWFQSVTNYLESVTHKLDSSVSAPAEPEAIHPEAIAQPDDENTSDLGCPQCGSIEVRKNGKRSGKQKYLCKSCGRQFTSTQPEPIAAKSSKRKRAKGFGTGR